MDTLDLFQRLGLALAIGLLIGIERGWQEREAASGSRVAGIRTFALTGLLGGVWGALFPVIGPIPLGLAAFGFAAALTVFDWRRAVAENNFSATGMIAGLLTFALGAFAVMGNMAAAAAAAVAATALLAEREALHEWLKKVTWPELRSGLLLLAMSFVLLPVLPNHAIDPWGALNPYVLWLMTVLIAAISYAGYIATRVAGPRRGLFYAGAVGGLISSTTVTLVYSQLVRKQPALRGQTAPGIMASWVVSLLRMGALASILAPPLFMPLSLPILGAALLLAGAGLLFDHRAARAMEAPPLDLANPFEIGEVLRFGLLLAVIMVVARLLLTSFGASGLLPLAAVTGLADVDPITLSVARMLGVHLSADAGALAILVAGAANLLTKGTVAVAVGGWRHGMLLALAAGCAIALGGAIHVLVMI